MIEKPMDVFNPQVVDYQGKPHLSFTLFTGAYRGGDGGTSSYSELMDDTYTVVRVVRPNAMYLNETLTQDLHEFQIVGPGGSSALMTSYVTYPANLSFPACPDAPTTSYMKTGVFSEVSTDGSNTTIFLWSATDHVDPQDTYVCPGTIDAGFGNSTETGFDFL